MRFDALIAGAGPAGSVAALLLARAGWSVALVEKSSFPRRKVCGEFVSAAAMPVLEACGLADAFVGAAGPPVMQLGLYAGETMLVSPARHFWGRALGREHLDTMLRDAAVSAGARLFQPARLVAAARGGNGYLCDLHDAQHGRQIVANTVIAACGSWNAEGRFAIPRHGTAPSDLFAFKAHFHGSRLPPGLMPLLAFPGGYGGMVQSDGGRLSLSCCIRRDTLTAARHRHGGRAAQAVWAHIAATTKGAAQVLEGAVPDGALSVGPIRPGIRLRQRDGIFFTGNIAGEAHPIIAEGIGMAIQSSAVLAGRLITGGPQSRIGADYDVMWRRCFATRIRAAAVFAHLAMRGSTSKACRGIIMRFPGLLDWGARVSGKT